MTKVGTTITEDQAIAIAALGGVVTLIEDAVQNLEDMRLEDDEVEALVCMPLDWRVGVTGRLMQLAESLRESLRELDGRVLQLTSGRLGVTV